MVVVFSIVTDQGTAMGEATLCLEHFKDVVVKESAEDAARGAGDVGIPLQWAASDGNDAVACVVCGSQR